MIIKVVGKDKYYCKIVLLKCEECGKEHQRKLSSVKLSRKRRGSDIDVCLKCSRLHKYRKYASGEEMPNWKGGRVTHSSGYDMLLTYPEKKGGARYEFVHVLNMEKKIGRKRHKGESIHHIDCDKKNNDIDNLFLCSSEKKHQKLHASMKKCGYGLLDKFIYFNRDGKKYQLKECQNEVFESPDIVGAEITCHACRGVMYAFVRIDGTTKRYHVFLIENSIGRKLFRDECIHHIDGDSINNDMNNLCLMTNSEHTICHRSIEHCVAELYKQGLVGFDKETGKYFVVEK